MGRNWHQARLPLVLRWYQGSESHSWLHANVSIRSIRLQALRRRGIHTEVSHQLQTGLLLPAVSDGHHEGCFQTLFFWLCLQASLC